MTTVARSPHAADTGARHPLPLVPLDTAPQHARRYVRARCAELGVSPEITDDAAQVTGELVTLSIRQSRTMLDVDVAPSSDGVIVRIHDRGHGSPAARHGVSDDRAWDVARRLSTTLGYGTTAKGRLLMAGFRCAVAPRPPAGLCGGQA